MAESPVWLITGASSGIGLAMLKHALSRGARVVAALRKPDVLAPLAHAYPSTQLLLAAVDVTSLETIHAVFALVQDHFGRLDVVFNNAGLGVVAEIESPDGMDYARKCFDVNVWGALEVSRAAVRFFREVNPPGVGGRLIQSGSKTGIQAIPCIGFYSASKYALEGFTEALASELQPEWAIKITIVQFGDFESKIAENSLFGAVPSAYIDETTGTPSTRVYLSQRTSTANKAEDAADRVWKLAQLETPPLRLVLGADAVRVMREKIAVLNDTVDTYESWSDNMLSG
ncbi:NAD(P)-binding protein [Exidia glandulosa HHB12029]|uniref:NAD(P)-binding protein n=1 Tax=Exidia glandulosa HHB12029 TaxID=1314781 RepID=A0A165CTT1_EXIGL|nr:NAD(P)-binding protein [Exidia glandulosa HHB12029]